MPHKRSIVASRQNNRVSVRVRFETSELEQCNSKFSGEIHNTQDIMNKVLWVLEGHPSGYFAPRGQYRRPTSSQQAVNILLCQETRSDRLGSQLIPSSRRECETNILGMICVNRLDGATRLIVLWFLLSVRLLTYFYTVVLFSCLTSFIFLLFLLYFISFFAFLFSFFFSLSLSLLPFSSLSYIFIKLFSFSLFILPFLLTFSSPLIVLYKTVRIPQYG